MPSSGAPTVSSRAPLWRPALMAVVSGGYWLLRQNPDRVQTRPWQTYAIMTLLAVVSAVSVWGFQRVRGSYWPWYVEMFALLGAFFVSTLALVQLVSLLRN